MTLRPPRYTLLLICMSGLCCAYAFWMFIEAPPTPNDRLIFIQKEKTFKQAQKECVQQNSSVPGLINLIQLARFDLLPHPKTDYWSSLSIGSFAFGWSTRTGMLSFDPHNDTDHVVCFQKK